VLSRASLSAGFEAVGLRRGQVVLVHAALRTLGPVDGGALAVVDALRAVLGPRGTLVAPTFTFAHEAEPEQSLIDPAADRSEMGAISEAVRRHPDARRSIAFRHSVAAIGRRADLIASVEHRLSPFDPRSTFGLLTGLDAQVLLIGVTYAASTAHHFAEWLADVPYRHTVRRHVRLRRPAGSGDTVIVETTMDDDQPIRGPDGGYVDGRRADFNRLGRMLEGQGRVDVGAVGNAIVRRFAMRDLVTLATGEAERDIEVFRTPTPETPPMLLPDGHLVLAPPMQDGAGRTQRHLWNVVDPAAIVGWDPSWEVLS
jgi:aminoglycoside N3'-acetyltransferase